MAGLSLERWNAYCMLGYLIVMLFVEEVRCFSKAETPFRRRIEDIGQIASNNACASGAFPPTLVPRHLRPNRLRYLCWSPNPVCRRSRCSIVGVASFPPNTNTNTNNNNDDDDDDTESDSSPSPSSSSSRSPPPKKRQNGSSKNDMRSLLSQAVAKASADRLRRQTNEQPQSPQSPTTSSSTRSFSSHDDSGWFETPSISTQDDETDEEDEGDSLIELTRAIDQRLVTLGPRSTDLDSYPRMDGLVQSVRDNMTSLLGFNTQTQVDWYNRSFEGSTHSVVVVFGKPLVDDRITVEYAHRIRTLVRLWKEHQQQQQQPQQQEQQEEEKEKEEEEEEGGYGSSSSAQVTFFRPSLVCFSGGRGKGNHISDADAGYIFFRHLCDAQGIDLDGVGILVDNKRRNEEDAVKFITEKVKSKYVPRWLKDSLRRELMFGEEKVRLARGGGIENEEEEEMGRRKIEVHFVLVSTEYHLCNINDVHHRSPQRSLLSIMEGIGGVFGDDDDRYWGYAAGGPSSPYDSYYGYRPDIYDDRDNGLEEVGVDGGNKNEEEEEDVVRGIVATSWSFQYATYPYLYSKDDASVFLGKCFLLGEELTPLLVNMKGVVDQKEFFQRDNYLMLASIRRSLVHHIEDLHKPRSKRLYRALKARDVSIRSGGRVDGDGSGGSGVRGGRGRGNKYRNTNQRDVIGVLEIALLNLGRCVDLVKPAGLLVSSVPKTDWVKALRALETSMSDIRELCDPDTPLRPSGWGKLDDDDNDDDQRGGG